MLILPPSSEPDFAHGELLLQQDSGWESAAASQAALPKSTSEKNDTIGHEKQPASKAMRLMLGPVIIYIGTMENNRILCL
jgi:hypothetical protein